MPKISGILDYIHVYTRIYVYILVYTVIYISCDRWKAIYVYILVYTVIYVSRDRWKAIELKKTIDMLSRPEFDSKELDPNLHKRMQQAVHWMDSCRA